MEIEKEKEDNNQATKQDIKQIKEELVSIRKELKGLIEIQQRLIHERLGVPAPPPPSEEEQIPVKKMNNRKINILTYGEDSIQVAGNTFDHRDNIRRAGNAKFEQNSKSWILPLNCLEKLIKILEENKLKNDIDFFVDVKTTGQSTTEESMF